MPESLPDPVGNPTRDKQQPNSWNPFCNKWHRESGEQAVDEIQASSDGYRRKVKVNLYQKKRVEKIIPNPLRLSVVKFSPCNEIVQRGSGYPHPHSNRFRSVFLADSQSNISSLPSARRRSVSANSLPCQAGDLNSAFGRLNSSQRVSINRSFSIRGNLRTASIVILIKC
jgi:hypothetical protein